MQNLSPRKILIDFLGKKLKNKEELKILLSKISGIAHIGIEVDNIEKYIIDLQTTHPERNYQLTKKFASVSVPQNYSGSQCTIAKIKSGDRSYPNLELFLVDWRGKYQKMPERQRKKIIEHVALRANKPEYVQEIINELSTQNQIKAISPQINKESGELFGYLINKTGQKIEIVSDANS